MPDSKRPFTAAAASGVAAVLSALGVAACASTSKDEIESRLLALSKNARAREHGLSRSEIELSLDGRTVAAEVIHLQVPARTPAVPPLPPLPPVVLVHGTPSSLFTWTPLIFGDGDEFAGLAALLPGRDIYAIDIIGHGVTRTDPPGAVTFQTCADWVAGAIAGLGLRDVVLVGNSYGGEFAWRAALDHPELVGRLVLLDTSGHPRADDEWLPEEVAMREMSLAYVGYVLNSPDRIRTALAPHFPAGVTDDQVAEIHLICDNAANWQAMVDLARDENGDRKGDLARITQPTLLLWGADDAAYGIERFARLFERDIPGARLVLIDDAGHYPHESRPAQVAARITEFLGDETTRHE